MQYQARFLGLLLFLVLPGTAAVASATSATSDGNELILHFMRSPTGMNWRSPQTLARSVLANTVARYAGQQHSIGHVQTELNCSGSDGLPPFYQGSGMTSEGENQESDLVLKQKAGLSVIFFNFLGHFQTGEEVAEDLRIHYENGRTNYVVFEISAATCRRLQQFVTEYQEREYWRAYGLPNRPRYGEGGGCSAYGASFVEVGGLMLPEFRTHWTRYRRVPTRYMGGWLNPDNEVSIFKLAGSFGAQWADADEPHQEIFFWDPDLMNHWVKYAHREIRRGRMDLGVKTVLERRGKAYGLRLDMRSVATPDGPIWLHETAGPAPVSLDEIMPFESVEEFEPAAVDVGFSVSPAQLEKLLRNLERKSAPKKVLPISLPILELASQ